MILQGVTPSTSDAPITQADQRAELRRAAEGFEAIMIRQMLEIPY